MSLITVATILVGLGLLVLVVLFLSRPLLRPEPVESSLPSARSKLLEQKAVILDEIRALDFDHETGKMPDDVYELQRAFLLEQAAETLQALDELPEAPPPDDVVAQINDAIAALRNRPAPVPQTTARNNGRAGFCTACGQPLDVGDRFCASCGQAVSVPQPTT